MPEGRTADRLRTLITDLSKKYRTRDFQPHVTLLGELNLPEAKTVAMSARVAKRINPFPVRLGELAHLDQYFRCVFSKAAKTEALMSARTAALDVFKQDNDEEYLPHLSLIYGWINPQTRQQIIKDIGAKLDIEFQVNELHLYFTARQPRFWHRVARMPCGGCDS